MFECIPVAWYKNVNLAEPYDKLLSRNGSGQLNIKLQKVRVALQQEDKLQIVKDVKTCFFSSIATCIDVKSKWTAHYAVPHVL